MKKEMVESIASAATKTTYGAAGITVFGGLTVEEWGVVGVISGIALGVATFAFNVWFKLKYQRGNGNSN